jgi:hypothetical protein
VLNKLHGLKVGDVDIGDLSTAAVDDLYKSLWGIKDDATAQPVIDRVLAIPGVGAIIKPTVGAIRAKLDALTTT